MSNSLNETLFPNNTNSTSGVDSSNESGYLLSDNAASVLYCACAMILFMFCFTTRRRTPPEHMQRGALIRANAERSRRIRERQAKLSDPKLREEAIERALLVQQIQRVNSRGEMTLSEVDPEKGIAENVVVNQDDIDEDSACVICLEPFLPGEIVAMSRQIAEGNSACPHVFHRECITEWLQNTKHDDCPSCRTILLLEPGEEDTVIHSTPSQDEEDAAYSSSTAFVIMNGLVSRVRRASYSLIARAQSQTGFSFESDEGTDFPPPTPKASPLRRVFSAGDRQRKNNPYQLRTRRSFGWQNQRPLPVEHSRVMPPRIEAIGLPPSAPLRRVLSVGPGSSPSRSGTLTLRRPPRVPSGDQLLNHADSILFRPTKSALLWKTNSLSNDIDMSENIDEEEDDILLASSSEDKIEDSLSVPSRGDPFRRS